MQKLLEDFVALTAQTKPVDAMDFYINDHRCGVITRSIWADFEAIPQSIRKDICFSQCHLTLQLPEDVNDRNRKLHEIASELSQAGLLTKWRHEDLDVFDLDTGEVFAKVERALFRFFGMKTQAVYAVGVSPDRRYWSGLRALTKPIDPGLWDTLAAGLIASGETPMSALLRELHEEAGLREQDLQFLGAPAQFTVTRVVPEGWMHELAYVFPCVVPDDSKVHNVDGEVSAFTLFSQDELLEKIRTQQTPADTAVAFLKTIELLK